MSFPIKPFFSIIILMFMVLGSFRWQQPETLEIKDGAHISLIGGNLGSRMMNYGHFETEMHVRYPEKSLLIRNMCDGGDTPGFRPHASRFSPWAFLGAEKFQTEYATNSDSEGHFDSPDQWLTRLQTDVIIAFFGYSESFQGKAGLENYKAELDAFIKYTLSQKYNGNSAPQLAIVSPTAFEDLTSIYDLPNGEKENENLLLYTKAMKEVAQKNKVQFVDAFTPSKPGLNSKIKVEGFGIAKLNWKIFNRWGQLVFESNNKNDGWDGKFKGEIQPMDVYVFTLDLEFSDGKKMRKTGDITLLK